MKNIERRQFVGSVIGAFGLAGLGSEKFKSSLTDRDESDQSGVTVRLKGKQASGVEHWDIITIGNLSRNRYWGESDEKALHSVICTCTVIIVDKLHIIVDPSLSDETAMASELKRRTGLSPDNIDAVFITHQHGDHVAGLKHFMKARWLAGPEVASGLNKSSLYPKQVEPAGKTLFGTIDVIPAPGHTPDLQILRFDYNGLSVVIAGDSVATKDFWDDRRAYYNVMDEKESKRSMEKIDSLADIIVPGHDNYFLNLKTY
jgi:glyoxylase-like metal-dependent hydrolase (beta-lactamase superfamily II)